MADKRQTKVVRFRILKPADGMTWAELGQLLRDARYRVFRLGNLAISEAYLNFHLWRTGQAEKYATAPISELNTRLRKMLIEEQKFSSEACNRFSKEGALPDTVVGALTQYKIRALTSRSKWSEVVRGNASLPTFRNDGPIYVRCDKAGQKRLFRADSGDVLLDLMLCLKPYPRVVLQTGDIGEGVTAILNRLLENSNQSMSGYRQRCFEVKEDRNTRKWWLYVTYDFPSTSPPKLSPLRIVGVDLGWSCPLYAAVNDGYARLGWRQFSALAARIRLLQRQIMARRRSMLTGGKSNISQETARSGHGRKRKLRPIEQLEGRINSAYTTLNHQLSKAAVEFAKDQGAGVIQIEKLAGLQGTLSGTFLGQRWRYHQLQQFLKYKAEEAGIELREVDPRFTSRRCSKCGFVHEQFSREYRDAHTVDGRKARFLCPECEFEADPDYNAARNLATLDIEDKIKAQCKKQGIATSLTDEIEAAT